MSKKKIASLMLAFIMLASVCISPGIIPAVSAEMPETEPPVVTDATAPTPEETISLTPPEPEVTAPAESEAQIETEPVEYVDAAETEPAETEQSEAAADAKEPEENDDLRSVSGEQMPVTATRTQFHAVKRLFKTETTSASDTTAYLPNATYMMQLSNGGIIRFGNFHTHEVMYNGKWVPAYCLDMGLGSLPTNFDGSIDNYAEWSQYIDNTAEGNNKKMAITLVMAYSKKLLGSRAYTDWDYAAIQTVIWEIMSGRRQSTWPYMTTGIDMFGQNYDETTLFPGTDHISFNDASYPRARRPKPADFFFFSNGSNAYQYSRVYTYSSSSTQIANATAFNNGRQLYSDIIKALTMHTIPSFAYTSSSDAAAAGHVKNLQWDGNKYTITLTDTQGVIAHYMGKPCPSTWSANGVTYSLASNDSNMTQQLTISATDYNAVNGITLSWQQDTLDFNSTDGAMVFKPDNTDMQPTVFFDHAVPPLQKAYIKLAAPVSVSLKKTSQGSASVLDAIQGNPLYTLAGAVYEIHEGSATGPVVETLTTNANGEATGTKKYAIGTKLYAVEKTAPSGYLLNSSPVALTVSSGSNVFNVSDTPTFDPARLVIMKTGNENERIEGAVFEFRYYAQYWTTDKPQRVWYLQSDTNGKVQLDESYFAPGYTSDPLFRPFGNAAYLPLGFVCVTEVAAATGYVLPEGGIGQVGIFIKPGGTQTPQNGQPARAYWGDFAGKPLDAAHSKGIYKIENDAENQTITAVNRTQTTLEIVKSSTDGAVSGIQFEVEKLVDDAWTMLGSYTTNADGKISVETEQLAVGAQFRIREIVPQDYICTSENPQTITLAEGLNSVSFSNKPVARLEIVKTSTDGKVAGISFKVEKEVSGSWTALGTYKTDANGKISLTDLDVGQKLRITETVPADYVCTSENPQTITLKKGLNTVSFANKPVARLEIVKTSTDGKIEGISFKVEKEVSGSWTALGTYKTDANGKISLTDLDVGQKLRITETVPADYVCTSENPQTVTLKKGLNSVSFANRLLPSGHTVAANSETMGHYAYNLPSVDLEDAFYYNDLLPGDNVTVFGFAKVVYEDENGKTVVEDLMDADGPVSSTVTFVAEQGSGVVVIPFPGLDLSQLGGKRIVFGERMYVNDQILVEHFDEADELQTIYVKNPSGHTTATVDATESHYSYITPAVEITDRYFYHDLMPGEHTVVGYPVRVIQTDDGTLIEEPVMVDGKPMEVPVTFTVAEDTPDGYVDIHFTIPGTEIQGTKIVIGENLYFNGKQIQHHFDVNDEDQTVYPVTPEMGTTATVNGQHISYAVGKIAMQDVVALRNILPGTYRCEGQIMVKSKENGKTVATPLLVDGKPVIASQEITVEAADGKPQSVTVTMYFDEFDAELVRGLETVVFEKLFQIDADEETETVTHANPEDENQTVRFPDFKFRTVATAKGEHRVKAYGVLAPQDEVIYTDAIPGTTLIASATLMERVEKDGKVTLVPFLVDGKAITGETTITVEKASGSIIVKFPAFDVGKLAGRKLVVVEEMFTLDTSGNRVKLGEERDAENKEQTIEFYYAPTPTSPKTGDDTSLFWLWLFMFLGAGGVIISATVLIRTKQRG